MVTGDRRTIINELLFQPSNVYISELYAQTMFSIAVIIVIHDHLIFHQEQLLNTLLVQLLSYKFKINVLRLDNAAYLERKQFTTNFWPLILVCDLFTDFPLYHKKISFHWNICILQVSRNQFILRYL